jgi:hypothetical protein
MSSKTPNNFDLHRRFFKKIRCVSLGIAMTLEDSWGGDIVTAAIAHLAHSTPPLSRLDERDLASLKS